MTSNDIKNKDIIELCNMIEEWWKEHKYNTDNSGEYNIYDTKPDFVDKADSIHQSYILTDAIQNKGHLVGIL
jgi:hypothetical protein